MKVSVFTLGCKVNQYESDSIIKLLQEKGHQVSADLCFADVYIINTCAVTNEAEKKSRQTIAKCRALNPNAKVLVCGCASEKNAKQFEEIENVTYITGVNKKQLLAENLQNNGTNIVPHTLEYDDSYCSIPTKTRAYVKIQDGCNNFCSYCIIPYLRGRSRSRDMSSILQEVEMLSTQTKEIILTGIDVSDYKINNVRSLDILLDNLAPYKNKVRFRLGSLEQGVISDKFIESAKNINICPHFHLSLQSGCDATLKRMNRKYTTADYIQTINTLRQNFDNPSITTDVIVGFPEETEQEFEQTLEFIKQCKFSNIHIFPYSMRSGTVATRYKQVDGTIKKQRVQKLEQVRKQLFEQYLQSNQTKTLVVLVEEKEGEYYIGHSENYIKCYIPANVERNSFVNVVYDKPYKDGIIVKLV